jgi:hypothetical protein
MRVSRAGMDGERNAHPSYTIEAEKKDYRIRAFKMLKN